MEEKARPSAESMAYACAAVRFGVETADKYEWEVRSGRLIGKYPNGKIRYCVAPTGSRLSGDIPLIINLSGAIPI